MQREWPAHYLDGQTPIRRPATIRLMREALEVTTAGGWPRMWPYREIRQTQGAYEGEEVRLERGGPLPEVLIVSDRAFLSSWREVVPQPTRFLDDPARRARRIQLTVLAALGVIGITAVLYVWGIPALAALAAPRVPVAWEESLGRAVLGQIAPPDRVCADPRRQHALETIVARLVAA